MVHNFIMLGRKKKNQKEEEVKFEKHIVEKHSQPTFWLLRHLRVNLLEDQFS